MTHLWIDFGISVTGTIDWCFGLLQICLSHWPPNCRV